jgi:HD-GYP domain-containing protein (c-di-GMP phosphodiesterase class II)
MIPNSIIQKQGFLDEQEKVYIKQHCELGVSITNPYDMPKASTAIILQHHERLDGSGYPYGVTVDEIHECAKIAMIADVFDAITSPRPYRSSQDIPAALSLLKDCRSQFDQHYVSVFERLLRQ